MHMLSGTCDFLMAD